MITENEIHKLLNEFDYDIRKSGNARWIDQKCTPDVVSIIADCILDYVEKVGIGAKFNSTDIWHNNYTEQNVKEIFNKPSTNSILSRNEYDKFFSQPLEMLAYSGILNKNRVSNRNYYTINNYELLEYISIKERFALNFIILYCEKVLSDSGIWEEFSTFFYEQSSLAYNRLKTNFVKFTIDNTPINGATEVRRIFTKVLNPLAYKFRKKGTNRGYISKYPITYSDLMYNRENFRDINKEKPKGVTRREWNNMNKTVINFSYYKYQSTKAKKFLKKYNLLKRQGTSEVNDEYSNGDATQIHHIFPESEFPEISMYFENLIALTPTQHLTLAHPGNNTNIISKDYQEILLKAKAGIIHEDMIREEDSIYSFDNLVEVLEVGFDKEIFIENVDYTSIMKLISNLYSN